MDYTDSPEKYTFTFADANRFLNGGRGPVGRFCLNDPKFDPEEVVNAYRNRVQKEAKKRLGGLEYNTFGSVQELAKVLWEMSETMQEGAMFLEGLAGYAEDAGSEKAECIKEAADGLSKDAEEYRDNASNLKRDTERLMCHVNPPQGYDLAEDGDPQDLFEAVLEIAQHLGQRLAA